MAGGVAGPGRYRAIIPNGSFSVGAGSGTAREALGFVTGGCVARGGVGTTSAEGSAGFTEDLTRGAAEGTPGEFGAGAVVPGRLAVLPEARTTCRRQ